MVPGTVAGQCLLFLLEAGPELSDEQGDVLPGVGPAPGDLKALVVKSDDLVNNRLSNSGQTWLGS